MPHSGRGLGASTINRDTTVKHQAAQDSDRHF
jgi:hypothetical protein